MRSTVALILVAVSTMATASSPVGTWLGKGNPGETLTLTIKSDKSWILNSSQEGVDPVYGKGRWSLSVDRLTLNRKAKDAQPMVYTVSKDGKKLVSTDPAIPSYHRK